MVRGEINPHTLLKLVSGIVLDDGPTLPVAISVLDPHRFSITLKEGRKHQIRRMANYVSLTIVKLIRVQIGSFKLGNLAEGEFKILLPSEVKLLTTETLE